MADPEFFKKYAPLAAYRSERYGKATLFQNEYLLVGLNGLEAGQSMEKHAHDQQTRFYLVLEGKGQAWVGEHTEAVEAGSVIWIPYGYTHRVENTGTERMLMLVGIGPGQTD